MSDPETESLSIGIVTYNSGAVIEQALASVLTFVPVWLPYRLVVFDNRSTDDTLERLRQMTAGNPNAAVVAHDQNIGFGAGHNRIFQQVDSRYHIICNPDIVVMPQAIEILVKYLRAHPDVGIVCPRFHYMDGRLQPLNRLYPTILDLFLRRFAPARLQSMASARMNRYEMKDVGYAHSYDVPFVSGAFMVCRTDALRQVGGFDESYFLYFEDADLSRRIQNAGWRTCFCSDAVVMHGWQRDAHRSFKGMSRFVRSSFRYFSRWGWRWA